MTEHVILVDEKDIEIGVEEKLVAHKMGKLHRCFSIFIFNKKGKLLIQQRAKEKYHSGGLWVNTCCGHPRPGEDTDVAAERRLMEELGFNCHLNEGFTFTYQAEFNNGLTENEFDHVMIGVWNGTPKLNPDEVQNYKWVDMDSLRTDMINSPDVYAVWFKTATNILMDEYEYLIPNR